MKFKYPEGQVARWRIGLSFYKMKIEHRPGRQHRNAYGSSRIPCKQCGINETNEAECSMVVCQVNTQDIDKASSEIRCAQETDPDICKVKRWIRNIIRPEQKEIACESYFMKSL